MSLVDPPLFKTFKPKGSLNELKFQISSLHINDKQDNIIIVSGIEAEIYVIFYDQFRCNRNTQNPYSYSKKVHDDKIKTTIKIKIIHAITTDVISS